MCGDCNLIDLFTDRDDRRNSIPRWNRYIVHHTCEYRINASLISGIKRLVEDRSLTYNGLLFQIATWMKNCLIGTQATSSFIYWQFVNANKLITINKHKREKYLQNTIKRVYYQLNRLYAIRTSLKFKIR